MKYLSLVTSPFQLIALAEYLYQFDKPEGRIIVLCQNDKTIESQIKYTANVLGLDIFTLMRFDSKFQSHYFQLRKLKEEVGTLILGHLFSEPLICMANWVSYSNVVILDDGLSTLKIPEIFAEKRYLDKSKSLANKLVKKVLGINTTLPERAELFTLFKVGKAPNLKIQINELSYLRTFLNEKKVVSRCYFVGQPFVENGELTIDGYLDNISNFLNEKGEEFSEVLYITHRKETDEKLASIASLATNIRTVRFKTSLEIEMITGEEIPSAIVGFSSTALITLKSIFSPLEEVSFFSLHLDKVSYLKNADKHQLNADYVKNYNIPTLRLG